MYKQNISFILIDVNNFHEVFSKFLNESNSIVSISHFQAVDLNPVGSGVVAMIAFFGGDELVFVRECIFSMFLSILMILITLHFLKKFKKKVKAMNEILFIKLKEMSLELQKK